MSTTVQPPVAERESELKYADQTFDALLTSSEYEAEPINFARREIESALDKDLSTIQQPVDMYILYQKFIELSIKEDHSIPALTKENLTLYYTWYKFSTFYGNESTVKLFSKCIQEEKGSAEALERSMVDALLAHAEENPIAQTKNDDDEKFELQITAFKTEFKNSYVIDLFELRIKASLSADQEVSPTYLSVTNSSGTGKSRLCFEMLKRHTGVFLCLRTVFIWEHSLIELVPVQVRTKTQNYS